MLPTSTLLLNTLTLKCTAFLNEVLFGQVRIEKRFLKGKFHTGVKAAFLNCSFNQALSRMKAEWKDIEFVFVQYKDTGLSILSAVDDLQVIFQYFSQCLVSVI